MRDDIMYCTRCGTQFEGNFCPNCGQPIEHSGIITTQEGAAVQPIAQATPETEIETVTQDKKKKSIFKRAWFWIVLVVLVAAVAVGSVFIFSGTNTAAKDEFVNTAASLSPTSYESLNSFADAGAQLLDSPERAFSEDDSWTLTSSEDGVNRYDIGYSLISEDDGILFVKCRNGKVSTVGFEQSYLNETNILCSKSYLSAIQYKSYIGDPNTMTMDDEDVQWEDLEHVASDSILGEGPSRLAFYWGDFKNIDGASLMVWYFHEDSFDYMSITVDK